MWLFWPVDSAWSAGARAAGADRCVTGSALASRAAEGAQPTHAVQRPSSGNSAFDEYRDADAERDSMRSAASSASSSSACAKSKDKAGVRSLHGRPPLSDLRSKARKAPAPNSRRQAQTNEARASALAFSFRDRPLTVIPRSWSTRIQDPGTVVSYAAVASYRQAALESCDCWILGSSPRMTTWAQR